MNENDLEQLRDFVNHYDEVEVSTNTILECIFVWDYIHEINDKSAKSFAELIDFIVLSQY
jgi:sulfur transfer complex TusBCD TusB component (DsrH family)